MNSGSVNITDPVAKRTAGTEVYNSVSPYGDQRTLAVMNTWHPACSLGEYFVVTNPTPGTGIATIATQATFADTSPFLLITNLDSAKEISLVYFKTILTVLGTNGAAFDFAVKTDNVSTRFSSGGVTNAAGGTLSVISPNSAQPGLSPGVVAVQAGALIANASNQPRLIDHVKTRTVAPVVGDTTVFTFGALEGVQSAAPMNGSVPSLFCATCPPVIIGPGHCAALHIWLTSQTVASQLEFTLAFVMR